MHETGNNTPARGASQGFRLPCPEPRNPWLAPRAGVGMLLFATTCLSLSSGCNSSTATTVTEAPAAYVAKSTETTVTVQPVVAKAIQSTHEFTGNLLPRRRIQITAEVEGIVAEIPQVGTSFDVDVAGKHYEERLGIGPGYVVNKGDILLKVDPADFQLEVAVAEAKLSKAEADLANLKAWKRPEEIRQLQAGRDEAQARHKNATEQLRRSKALVQRSALNKSELDTRISDAATAKAALDSQQAMLAVAEAGPTKEEVAVQESLVAQAAAELQQKQRELDKTIITAPGDGVVTEFSVEVGDRVGPTSGVIVELLDVRFLIAEAGVSETMVGKVKIKDLANVKLAGIDEPIPGMVVAINGKVDPESRTFRVRVAIDNSDGRYKAGQFASVVFRTGTESEHSAVPSRALTFVEGQPHVFIVDEDSVAHLRSVTVGESSGEFVQVLAGVSVGENVIIDDPALVADGLPVKVVENE